MLIEKVRTAVAPFYKTNDAAHGLDHADDVYTLMMHIVRKECIMVDTDDICFAAYYHDMFSTDGKINPAERRIHNVLAHDYIIENNIGGNTIIIAKAVFEHRASYKGEFSTILSEMISTADRGLPDMDAVVRRSLKYHGDKPNAAESVLAHVVVKFGSDGYAKYPDMYTRVFGEDLRKMQEKIDKLTLEQVEELRE